MTPRERVVQAIKEALLTAATTFREDQYRAYQRAKAELGESGSLPVPLHLRNAPTELMAREGYGKGYRYPHDFPGHVTEQDYLPDALKGRRFYEPSDEGEERRIKERLERWRRSLRPPT